MRQRKKMNRTFSAGQLMKIELLDHVIIGNSNFKSLRRLGYFMEAVRKTVSEGTRK